MVFYFDRITGLQYDKVFKFIYLILLDKIFYFTVNIIILIG